MAAGGVVSATYQYQQLQDKLEELTTCPICKERFKQPKILSCHHTFCFQCLQSYFMQTPEESSPCPLCRCLFFPPKGDVSNLPTSTFMQDVVMMIERKSPIMKKHCTVCKTTKNAGYMCVECDVQMCESCKDTHETFRKDSHNLLRLDEIEAVPIISVIAGKKTSRKCDKHSGQILEHLCLSCNIPMCSECKTTSHSQHRTQNINHAAEETRNFIRLIQKSSNPDVNRLTETITDIKSLSTSIQISTDAMKDEVRTMADLLVKMVREKERKMLHNIETDVVLRQKELKSIEDATEFRLTSLFTFLDYVKSLETFGDVTQLSVAKQTIQKRLEENKEQTVPTLPESCRCNRTFKRSHIFESILHSEDLGSIESIVPTAQRKPPPIPPRVANKFKPPPSTSSTPDQLPVIPQRDPRPADETSVKHVMESDNEYTNPKEYIWREASIDNPPPAVSSKEHNKIVTQKSRPLPPPPKPHTRYRMSMSMAGSEYLKVTSECQKQRIRRTMSDSQLLDETEVKSIQSPPGIENDGVSFNAKVKISGLAVTRKDDVVVVSNNSKKCLVFDKLGNLKNEISDRLVSPWDAAVNITEDDLKEVVYLTDTGERSGDGDVKEYRLDGTFVRILVRQLRKPHGITTSTDGDVIYVCDAEDSSIIVLQSRRRGQRPRKIKQNMLGKNFFTCPWYISLTTDGEIVVSDFNAGKLVGINKDTERKKKSYKPENSRNALGFRPAMSCVDSESNIFVVDQISNCIYVWTARQAPVKIAIPSSIDIKRPVALAFDSSGALWIGSRSGVLVRAHIHNL
ncbi:tripartite motif-containing protein 3-like [Pecten maximus]|uniref:tripartite motif-containing protein 3-like n=1 Tax=Pecten maximus TaxID=6579 RepID=UPI001458C8FC|nr:tripartite motif-containing protein 3-like [Pecten maximus]